VTASILVTPSHGLAKKNGTRSGVPRGLHTVRTFRNVRTGVPLLRKGRSAYCFIKLFSSKCVPRKLATCKTIDSGHAHMSTLSPDLDAAPVSGLRNPSPLSPGIVRSCVATREISCKYEIALVRYTCSRNEGNRLFLLHRHSDLRPSHKFIAPEMLKSIHAQHPTTTR
jgi:hypothetical protein